MATLLSARNINKYFYDPAKFHVLRDINFDIERGKFVSIIGKSGSGKSTLMYLLSTMDTDYEGQITVDGQVLTGRKPEELARFRNEHIGFVFQFHYLLPEFSVLQNVMLPALKLNRYSKEEIREKALNKLELLGIKDQAEKRASKLSGGQQQRVAIARALINDPLIIMGDEPTGNLDSQNSEIVFDILRELTQQMKQTIIVVTHDEDFAQRTDQIIEMVDGQIVGSHLSHSAV
ncbi:MAG: ABC transporter ATP-binding protein [Cyclobacteriaceae bacterium]